MPPLETQRRHDGRCRVVSGSCTGQLLHEGILEGLHLRGVARVVRAELGGVVLPELVHGQLLDRGVVPHPFIQLRLHLSRSGSHELLLLLLRLLLQRIVSSLKL